MIFVGHALLASSSLQKASSSGWDIATRSRRSHHTPNQIRKTAPQLARCLGVAVIGLPVGTSPTAAIAQLGERQTEDLKVPGSIPGLGIGYDIAWGHVGNQNFTHTCISQMPFWSPLGIEPSTGNLGKSTHFFAPRGKKHRKAGSTRIQRIPGFHEKT